MIVAIVTSYWKNSPGGGVLTFVTGLVTELQKNDIIVKVVFQQGRDSENTWIKGHRFLFPIKAFFALRKIRPEVIHSQGPWYCLFSGYLYKKIYGAKLIHTFLSEPDKIPFWLKIFMQTLCSKCDYVTFGSQGFKDKVENVWKLKFNNAPIIYNGVNFREVTQSEIQEFRKKFGLTNDTIILLSQAFTVNKDKAEGLKLLMKAIAKLGVKYPNIVLIVTREGHFSNELKEYTKILNLENRVIFTGDLDNPYVPIAICDIFTNIEIYGGFGMALLEAMTMGKPIVSTSFTGRINEAITDEENGIMVEATVDAIAAGLVRLVNEKDLATKLGECAKKTVLDNFTWEKSAKRFIRLYTGN